MGIQQSYPNPNNFYSTSLYIGGPSAFQNTMDVMDVNNDGIPDVGVNGYFSRGVAVALGSLTGDLGVPALFELGKGSDLRPMSFAFRDLDNDGLPDIVVAGINFSASATGVGVAAWLKGNGDGTFQTAVRIDQVVNNCAMPTAVTTVDIDQDGRPEIAVLCSSGQGVFISRRNFDGTWVLQTGVSINSSVGQNHGFSMRFGRVTTSTATGTDLVVAGYDNNGIRIINNISLSVTNSGTGAFSMISSPGSYVWLNGDSVADVTISDLDSDGLNDVVAIPRRTGYGSGGWGYEATHFWTCRSTGVTGQCARLNWGGDGVYQNSVVAGDVRNNDQPDIFISYQVPRLFYRTIARIMNISQ